MESPHTDLIRIALSRTSGADFEKFALQFLAARLGPRFVPLGGQRDGGADGLIDDTLYKHPDQSRTFMQASIEQNYKSKIRRTIKRLNDFGRNPNRLLYITNQFIPIIDKVAEELITELDVVIEIQDGNFIMNHISADSGSIAAYYTHLHHSTSFLEGVGRSSVLTPSQHVSEPHVYTYLVGELDRRASGNSFTDGVVDALIIFALEGTDPAKDIMMSEDEIRSTIIEKLPAAESILASRLRKRLEAISTKGTRRIKWHKKEDRWVLPYEQRKELNQASVEDEALRLRVHQELSEQFNTMNQLCDLDPNKLSELTLKTIQLAFQEDGLSFSRFLEDQSPEDSTPLISDALRSVLDDAQITGNERSQIGEAISKVLRSLFYASTPSQRTLLQRISRAYAIAFALNGEPRTLKYFDESISNTWLYIGADILILALSELYVQPEDQHTRNLLKSASTAGATLILTAPVLEEILGHLKGSDLEYKTYVEPMGEIDSYEIAYQVPKILVRAFLYSQIFDGGPTPRSWEQFINQFCNYPDLHSRSAEIQLKRYLVNQFKLRFEEWEQIKSVCTDERNELLTGSIKSIKKYSGFLARNDAYMYQLVTYRRSTRGEENKMSEFGYQTWWLSTGEGAAVREMAKIDRATHRILMRPGFLAKFIQLAPSASAARQSLSEFLPSLLGIKLARRVEEEDFHKLIDTVKEAESLEEGSRASKIADLNDKLKTVQYSEFDERFKPDEAGEFLSLD